MSKTQGCTFSGITIKLKKLPLLTRTSWGRAMGVAAEISFALWVMMGCATMEAAQLGLFLNCQNSHCTT
jgi:hypothetical protein